MGHIESDPRVRVERILLHPSNYANHDLPRVLGRKFDDVNAFADGILSRPELLGHVLIDEHDNRNPLMQGLETQAGFPAPSEGLGAGTNRDAFELMVADVGLEGRRVFSG